MKATSQKIILFTFPVLLVWASLFIFFEKNIKQNIYTIFKTEQTLKAAPEYFHYLVGGHSRLNRAINSEMLTSSVKTTTPGESFIETYYKLKYILNHTNKNFKNIILPFEAGTFKPNDFRRSIYWIKYMNFFEVGFRKGEFIRYFSAWVQAKVLPFLPYYKKKIKAAFYDKKKQINTDIINGKFSNFSKAEQDNAIQEDIEYLKKIGIIDKTAQHYVHEVILLAKKHNIQIIYIKSPLTRKYSEALSGLDENCSVTHDKLENFVRGFDHVSVLDMENIFWGQDSLFYDQHHLNKEGSYIFTKKLMKQLVASGNY